MSDVIRAPYDILEAFFAPATNGDDQNFVRARAAWRVHRLDHRRAQRISSTTLPRVSEAALEAEQAKRHAQDATAAAQRAGDHAQRSLDAIGGITRGRDDETPTDPR